MTVRIAWHPFPAWLPPTRRKLRSTHSLDSACEEALRSYSSTDLSRWPRRDDPHFLPDKAGILDCLAEKQHLIASQQRRERILVYQNVVLLPTARANELGQSRL